MYIKILNVSQLLNALLANKILIMLIIAAKILWETDNLIADERAWQFKGTSSSRHVISM